MNLTDLDSQTYFQITSTVITLQQQLEAAETENQLVKSRKRLTFLSSKQLKHDIDKYKERYELDQHCTEQKLKAALQEISVLYNTQERLEYDLYGKEQELDTLRKDTQQWKRLYKDLDKSLTIEREEFDKDRSSWHHRESQMKDQFRLLQQKDQYHHRLSRRKNGLLSAHSTPQIPSLVDRAQAFDDETKGDGYTIAASLSENNQTERLRPASSSLTLEPLNLADQQTIKAQETMIADLKLDLEQQTLKLHQQHLLERHESFLRMNDLIAQVNHFQQLNQSLMEENESYQILLHEKTICGEFMSDPIVQYDEDTDYFGPHATRSINSGGLNLADELTMASNQNAHHKWSPKEEELMAEIKTLQDANRALQLYMNKILLRIVENKHLETVLSIDEPSKGTTATIIKSTSMQTRPSLNPSQTDSYNSFHVDETMTLSVTEASKSSDTTSTTSSDDGGDDSDIGGDNGTGSGTDSWTQVFRRMSSGLSVWSKSNETAYEKTSLEVDNSVRSLYLLNK